MQNLILNMSPALFPLLTLPLSFIQSWHCSTMCGSIYVSKTRFDGNRYLQGRWVSYTLAGGVLGWLGQQLQKGLEWKAMGAIVFLVFSGISVLLASLWAGHHFLKFKLPFLNKTQISKFASRSSFIQGLASVALPCSLLYQVFALSALSHSLVGGLLIGSAHAIATTPGFWASRRLSEFLQRKGKGFQRVAKVLVLALVVFNLFYFAGRLFNSEDVSKTKILFCF